MAVSQVCTTKIVILLSSHNENRLCFDCDQKAPTHINLTVGSFVCTICAAILRKYEQNVKSILLANFDQTEIMFLIKRGNKACRKIYATFNGMKLSESYLNLDVYLKSKYDNQNWYLKSTPEVEEEAKEENYEILQRASQSYSAKQHPTASNPAALLVLPPKGNLASIPVVSPTISSSIDFPCGAQTTTGLTRRASAFNLGTNNKIIASKPNTSSTNAYPCIARRSSFSNTKEENKIGLKTSFKLKFAENNSSHRFCTANNIPLSKTTLSNSASNLKNCANADASSNSLDLTDTSFSSNNDLLGLFSPAATNVLTLDKYVALAELDDMAKFSSTIPKPTLTGLPSPEEHRVTVNGIISTTAYCQLTGNISAAVPTNARNSSQNSPQQLPIRSPTAFNNYTVANYNKSTGQGSTLVGNPLITSLQSTTGSPFNSNAFSQGSSLSWLEHIPTQVLHNNELSVEPKPQRRFLLPDEE